MTQRSPAYWVQGESACNRSVLRNASEEGGGWRGEGGFRVGSRGE